jgi:hypothetical protein
MTLSRDVSGESGESGEGEGYQDPNSPTSTYIELDSTTAQRKRKVSFAAAVSNEWIEKQ